MNTKSRWRPKILPLALLWSLLPGLSTGQELQHVDWPELEKSIDEQVRRVRPYLSDIRRGFYRFPELPARSERTVNVIEGSWVASGFKVTRIGRSLVGTLQGDRPGPSVAIRFEMDALPILNPSQSPRPGVAIQGAQHALGNDAQLAIASALAGVFGKIKKEIPGTIRLIVESGSSLLEGALPLVEGDALQFDPEIELVIALKPSPLPAGQVGVSLGQVTAAADVFEVELGDGITPQAFARQLEALVPTLGPAPAWDQAEFFSDHARSSQSNKNLISLSWTLVEHSMNPRFRGLLMASQEGQFRAIRGIIEEALAPLFDEVSLSFPMEPVAPVRNDPTLAELAITYLKEALGAEQVLEFKAPNLLVADDLSLFESETKTLLLWLGVANSELGIRGIPGEPDFDIDKKALLIGLNTMAKLPLRYMAERVNSVLEGQSGSHE